MEKADWDRLVDNLMKEGILRTPKVIKAMRTVPRTNFLPADVQGHATADTPLPIGMGQTISAPHMVSIMNEALELEVGHKVLEVGAGSAWHAATMAEIIAPMDAPRSEWGHVFTIEVVRALADTARKNILNAGYSDRVTVVNADGSKGFPEKAPFDRITVAAAAPNVPKPLVDQLKVNGVLLIPVGSAFMFQNLIKITKQPDGKLAERNLGGVAFVPLTGEYGQRF